MAFTEPLKAGAVALFILAILQANNVGGTQLNQATTTETPTVAKHPSVFHDIGKRSVSILARNGELPYYRKEWNKKLHPGFRGFNVENADETSVVSQRNVGALARGGGLPSTFGKRDSYVEESPEEAILDAYLEELRRNLIQHELASEERNMDGVENGLDEEDSEEFEEKRGGVGSLARAGYMPNGGRYLAGKRSLAALARSGEILSIGRGSNQEREGGNKRGLGSILRNGGISNLGRLTAGKRGIESLARNYALPSMLSDDHARKYDLMEEEGMGSAEESFGDDYSGVPEAPGLNYEDEMIKRHLGSFARNYGLRLGSKRNIGSILRGGGSLHYGKRAETPDYDEDYSSADKRHISSLMKSQGKRDGDEEYAWNEEKRHLSSILNDRSAFVKGKRYLGSLARQGLLGSRHEKRDAGEEAYENGQYARGDFAVDKRSVLEDHSASIKGEDGRVSKNGTTNEGLKGKDLDRSLQRIKQEGGLSEEMRKEGKERYSLRRRRSLKMPYSSNDEYPMPVMQNTDFYDWETAEDDDITEGPEKRFMGSLPRWSSRLFASVPVDDNAGPATYQLQKRHIGALARLGWLPAIRSQRRFSRGLGKRNAEAVREDSSHGTEQTATWRPAAIFKAKTSPSVKAGGWPQMARENGADAREDGADSGDEDWTIVDDRDTNGGLLAEKRYLLLPAIDHLLLRKLYPRQMLPIVV